MWRFLVAPDPTHVLNRARTITVVEPKRCAEQKGRKRIETHGRGAVEEITKFAPVRCVHPHAVLGIDDREVGRKTARQLEPLCMTAFTVVPTPQDGDGHGREQGTGGENTLDHTGAPRGMHRAAEQSDWPRRNRSVLEKRAQVALKIGGRGITVARPTAHPLLDDGHEFPRKERVAAREGYRRARSERMQDGRGRTRIGRLQGEEAVEHCRQPIDVRLGCRPRAGMEEFGIAVRRRSHARTRLSQVCRLGEVRDAEVEQHRASILSDQNVAGFDIAVHDTRRVRRPKSGRDFKAP